MLNKLRKNKKGFTLIELIVVIAILGILAAILIPTVGGYVQRSNYSAAQSEGTSVVTAAKAYETLIGADIADEPDTVAAYVTQLKGDTGFENIEELTDTEDLSVGIYVIVEDDDDLGFTLTAVYVIKGNGMSRAIAFWNGSTWKEVKADEIELPAEG